MWVYHYRAPPSRLCADGYGPENENRAGFFGFTVVTGTNRAAERQMATSDLGGSDGKGTNFQVVFLVCSRMTRPTSRRGPHEKANCIMSRQATNS